MLASGKGHGVAEEVLDGLVTSCSFRLAAFGRCAHCSPVPVRATPYWLETTAPAGPFRVAIDWRPRRRPRGGRTGVCGAHQFEDGTISARHSGRKAAQETEERERTEADHRARPPGPTCSVCRRDAETRRIRDVGGRAAQLFRSEVRRPPEREGGGDSH